ncbi:phage baseplate assembly protein V [Pseudomonas gingeri]|uniref:phage baseplate assembly protein V n=1 Tax=Pseudomonas gingeri TaxID=117681 RepID=UPI0015A1A124|nr:phage baseplate assembly protein V [Pseudomonas gingeri]NWA04806.1 phage baseplate assembly protein V [Pseudomonas gingeri]NWA17687.1 phage baseplate assembly protein V [Pseudomonas gingeri]NWA56905.1 phage baseplate assembly protein V [Pseudomonas gingeri]NWA97229.1 phage baseplate assembly protein V [Pseudomonas gingeri]NWB01719.1 phage baseplate assembly protein V [Pseudomonas gingeri]
MSYASAQHDRMIADLVLPCFVVAVDLVAGKVRVSDGDGWASAWVKWHSQAAGKARHWRAPSLSEEGVLFSPSGDPAQGTFVPGLYGNAGPQPDNRDHVEVWRFDDGGSLIYDWQANSYTIELPAGTVTIKVGGSQLEVTPDQIRLLSSKIDLVGAVTVNGTLATTGNITSAGSIMDTTGNSANHKH